MSSILLQILGILFLVSAALAQPDPRIPRLYETHTATYDLPNFPDNHWVENVPIGPFDDRFESSSIKATFRAFIDDDGGFLDTELVFGELLTQGFLRYCRLSLNEADWRGHHGLTDPVICDARWADLRSDAWHLYPLVQFSGAAFGTDGPFFDRLIYRIDAWTFPAEDVFE